ncbi:MAG: type II secretion system F family protein, partial [Acidimicrobiia bacterium]|nr:type II secretion system F family protein [Acidimicrobiia bacterium]
MTTAAGRWSYRAYPAGGAGTATEGTIDALDEASAKALLRASGLMVTELRPARRALAATEIRLRRNKVRQADLAWMARNLATAQSSGLAIDKSVAMLAGQRAGSAIGAVLADIHRQLHTVGNLGQAFRSHEADLGALTCAMVEAGNESGTLDRSLDRLATLTEARVRLGRKVRSASAYPVLVLGLALVLFAAMLLFILPTFKKIYADLHGQLPLPTRVLMDISDAARSHLWAIPLLGVALVVGAKQAWSNERLRLWWDRTVLRLPIFGDLVRTAIMTRVAGSLSTLQGSGVDLRRSLELTARVASNRVFSTALERSKDAATGGTPLDRALRQQTDVFPELFVQLVGMGSETGGTVDLLDRYARDMEHDLETRLETLTALLEPFLIIFIGVVIGAG